MVNIGLGSAAPHISAFQSQTWNEMVANIPCWTSSWLQWNLGRPNSCFRDETITWASGDEEILPAEIGPDELLPKEAWLIDMIKAELAQRRKVVVYPRQTGTKDIRSCLVDILRRNGVCGVSVLDSGVNPKKRKAWLGKNAGQRKLEV